MKCHSWLAGCSRGTSSKKGDGRGQGATAAGSDSKSATKAKKST